MPQDKHLGVQNKTISKKRSTSDLDDEHWRCLRCKCPGHLTPVKRIGPDGHRVPRVIQDPYKTNLLISSPFATHVILEAEHRKIERRVDQLDPS